MVDRVFVELHPCEVCGRYYRPHPAEANAPQGVHRCARCAALMRPTPRDDGPREDWSAVVEKVRTDCGRDFIGARNQRLCPKCQEALTAASRARELAKRPHKPRGVCIECGAPTSSTRHKRCVACAKRVQRERTAAWWRRHRYGPDAALMIPREAKGKDGDE